MKTTRLLKIHKANYELASSKQETRGAVDTKVNSPLFPVVTVTRDSVLTYGQDTTFPLVGI